ncbi:MAG: iron-sulfur cluster assembly scaffold protein [Desulfatiglandaceae bacterium]
MIEYILWFLLVSGVLLGIVGAWITIYFWLAPHLDQADGRARITGKCGDTMEIGLKFHNDRVTETSHETDGCVYSLNCVNSAADLAKGKTPDEILDIDPRLIQQSVGGLPDDQIHCAHLAVETLQAALHDYMMKEGQKRDPAESGIQD